MIKEFNFFKGYRQKSKPKLVHALGLSISIFDLKYNTKLYCKEGYVCHYKYILDDCHFKYCSGPNAGEKYTVIMTNEYGFRREYCSCYLRSNQFEYYLDEKYTVRVVFV